MKNNYFVPNVEDLRIARILIKEEKMTLLFSKKENEILYRIIMKRMNSSLKEESNTISEQSFLPKKPINK